MSRNRNEFQDVLDKENRLRQIFIIYNILWNQTCNFSTPFNCRNLEIWISFVLISLFQSVLFQTIFTFSNGVDAFCICVLILKVEMAEVKFHISSSFFHINVVILPPFRYISLIQIYMPRNVLCNITLIFISYLLLSGIIVYSWHILYK